MLRGQCVSSVAEVLEPVSVALRFPAAIIHVSLNKQVL